MCKEFVAVERRDLVASEDPGESESPSRPSTAVWDGEGRKEMEVGGEKRRRGSAATTVRKGVFGVAAWQ